MPVSLNQEAYTKSWESDDVGFSSAIPAGVYNARCIDSVFKEKTGGMKSDAFILKWDTGSGIVEDFVTLSIKAYFRLTERLRACNLIISDPQTFEITAFVNRAAKITVSVEEKPGSKEGVTFKNNSVDRVEAIEGLDQKELDASTLGLTDVEPKDVAKESPPPAPVQAKEEKKAPSLPPEVSTSPSTDDDLPF